MAAGLAAVFVFASKGAGAESKINQPTGLTVSPAIQQVSIIPDESQHQLVYKITNNLNKDVRLKLSAADFNTLGDTGGLFFVGSNPSKEQKSYTLSQWINIPEPDILLAAKQTATVNIYILNQKTLTPGGHYGALMILPASTEDQSSSNKVALQPIASSLLFVNKVGGDIHDLRLNNVTTSRRLYGLPASVTLRFYNPGNTHVVPRGTVQVTSPGGKIISQGVINENSNILLPTAYRRYPVELRQINPPSAPGRYKLTVNYRFDGYNAFRSYQISIFIMPQNFIIMTIGLVVFLGFLAAYYAQNWPKKRRIKVRIED